MVLVALVLLGIQAYGFLPFATRPSELELGEPLTYRLDLNLATKGELMQLPGVGPKMADRILDYRHKYGKLHSVADLAKIPGFGPATLKRLEGWVLVEGEQEPPAAPTKKVAAAAKPKPAAKQAVPKKGKADEPKGAKINLNTATQAELQKLPRIGPVLSQRIIEERQRKPFQSVDDLKRVKGIGAKTLESLRPFVTVGE
jgi:competence protein ComEA